jgi:cell division septum initiation protein DivIVA
MNENSDLLPNLLHEEFEMQMRGYSRRQVDDFVARRNSEIRELEQRLGRSLDETEHLRREVTTVRQQALAGRPAHEEVSERISQILKLADDEANAQRGKADDDISKQRAAAQQESERVRADAREQAERMLTAAQEQAERTISASRAEADKTRTGARNEADRLTTETRKKADAALAGAKAQAKKILDEANARATAIHDGAERRLSLLSTRHAETVRRLADILDGVQGLVAAENARMTLEEEVSAQAAKAIAMAEAAEADPAANPGPTAPDGPNGSQPLPPRANGSQPLAPRANGRGAPDEDRELAPPAPETVASGMAVPGRPLGRQGASLADSPSHGGPALPPPPSGPSVPGLPLPGMPPRHSAPVPGGQPHPGGPAGYPQDREQLRDALRDPLRDPLRESLRSTGTIDPDEPTEGIRLMQ